MTKLISDFKIESTTLEKKKDPNIEGIQNRVFVSTSFLTNSTREKLETLNLRLFISLDSDTSKIMDFISQRYNEYLISRPNKVSPHQLNNFLQSSLGTDKTYLRSANPFSPFSTNIESRNLVITDRVSAFGNGKTIAKNIIIYDAPLTEVLGTINNNIALLDPITIDLPSTSEQIKQMSIYGFVYDVRVPSLFRDSPETNFSINTGMTIATVSVPIGNKTSFLTPSVANPLVGMQELTVRAHPDKDSLHIINQLPDDAVVKKYTNIATRAQESLVAYTIDKNYEINKILKRDNYFSDLWASRDYKDNHKFVFAFDIRSYLSENGIFPFVYQSDVLSKMLIEGGDEISPLSLSSVLSIELFRHKIESEGFLSTNDLGTVGHVVQVTPSKTYPIVTVPKVKKVDINLPNNFATRDSDYKISFFEGYDDFGTENDNNRQINGTYQYSVKCIVKDNSPEMLRNLVNSMFTIKRSTHLIYGFLIGNTGRRDSIYDSQSGRLRKDIKTINTNIDGKVINISKEILENVDRYQLFLNALNPLEENLDLVGFYNNNFQAASGKVEVQIIRDFELLVDSGIRFIIEKLEKIFPLDPLGRQQSSVVNQFAQNSSKSVKNNLFTVQHTFSETYNKGKSSGYGLDYVFSAQSTTKTLNTISIDDYQTRRIEEFKKYFNGGTGAAELNPGGSYENPSYAYLTPKSIHTPSQPIIEQTSFASQDATTVEYNYDQYGQLFTDILSIDHQTEELGSLTPTLFGPASQQTLNNKMYSSALALLAGQFSVSISEVIIPQFSLPQVVRDGSSSTIYRRKNRETCGPNGGLPLIQSLIGGEDTQDTTTEAYLEQINTKIKGEDTERNRGAIDERAAINERKERAIKLPFTILGELTLDKAMDTAKNHEQDVFNSLTALRKILNISKSDVGQAIEGETISQMPNQLKSMLVISSTNDVSSLGSSDGSQGFDACRPKLKNESDPAKTGDLISFFGDQEEIPPYPQTEDPMKSYARFLAFWMNYRQIAVVEYLSDFGSLKETSVRAELIGQKLKLPRWSKLNATTTRELRENLGNILCRVRIMGAEDYLSLMDTALSPPQKKQVIKFFGSKELLNLPTYNQYFYIQSNTISQEVESDPQDQDLEPSPFLLGR